jgi:phosphoserine phosphatase RsbU/P
MTCTFVNAGHLPPIHLHRDTGNFTLWKTGGTVLGQFPSFTYQSETVPLTTGDKILFYTDGISECENGAGLMYTRERLNTFVIANRDSSPAQLIASLMAEIEQFKGDPNLPQSDDVTALLIEIE